MTKVSGSALWSLSRPSPSTWLRKGDPCRSELEHLPAQPRAAHRSMDLFVVPTISFIQLDVLVIVRLTRRELVWDQRDKAGLRDLRVVPRRIETDRTVHTTSGNSRRLKTRQRRGVENMICVAAKYVKSSFAASIPT
jgi:hypothetical protein